MVNPDLVHTLFDAVQPGAIGIVFFGLAGWLGKRWAEKLLAEERATHEAKLASFERESRAIIAGLQVELDVAKDKHLKGFYDKLATYRNIIDLVAEILSDLDAFYETGQQKPIEKYEELNKIRIRLYGHLCLIAPQAVMDAQDELIDYLLLVMNGTTPYVWETVREKALVLLNTARADIGIGHGDITYNGKL